MNSPDDALANGDQVPTPSLPPGVSAAQIIELERQQIGHDLHDLLLPLIFAANANLRSIVDPLTKADEPAVSDQASLARIRQSQEWLQQALSVGRSLLTHLYPPELDQLTWLAAAKDAARRICGEEFDLVWKVGQDSPVCDPNWDRDVAATAYRILTEALRNAVRHGNAEAISVRCDHDSLLIVDDGDGFDPASVDSSRFGIRSMKGRAKLVGKAVTLQSAPGGPTTVRMEL